MTSRHAVAVPSNARVFENYREVRNRSLISVSHKEWVLEHAAMIRKPAERSDIIRSSIRTRMDPQFVRPLDAFTYSTLSIERGGEMRLPVRRGPPVQSKPARAPDRSNRHPISVCSEDTANPHW
jgi:hypothetical protein